MLNRMDTKSQIKVLTDCRGLLADGCSVLFFPEGTRSKDCKLADFKKVIPNKPLYITGR
jgi:1-acyl-sn-glycerol-3-phosphate acyltransferase